MARTFFVCLASITFAGWRFHPGYRRDGVVPPSLSECVAQAEELWQLMQR